MNKTEVKELTNKLGLLKIKIDNELTVFDPEFIKQIHDKARKAMRKGATVTWEDGRTEWFDDHEIYDSSKAITSEAYTWSADGTKVAHERYLTTKIGDKIEKKFIKRIFKSF